MPSAVAATSWPRMTSAAIAPLVLAHVREQGAPVDVADRVEPVAPADPQLVVDLEVAVLVGSTPTLSRPSSSLRGRRPIATSTSVPLSGAALLELHRDAAVLGAHARGLRADVHGRPRSRGGRRRPARWRTAPRKTGARGRPPRRATPSSRACSTPAPARRRRGRRRARRGCRGPPSPSSPRGWSRARPRAARRSAAPRRSCRSRSTTALRATRTSSPATTRRSPSSAPRPRNSSIPLSSSHGTWRGVVEVVDDLVAAREHCGGDRARR